MMLASYIRCSTTWQLARTDGWQVRREFVGRQICQETQLSQVDPDHRALPAAHLMRGAQHRAIASQHDRQIERQTAAARRHRLGRGIRRRRDRGSAASSRSTCRARLALLHAGQQ